MVDPIDGTQPFVSGMTSWCVSIAYLRHGTVELGFVFSPARDELFVGRRGAGATLNGKPIQVRAATSLTEGLVGTGYSPRVPPAQFLPTFARLLDAGGMFYRDGSGALMLCYVACGRLLGYVEPHSIPGTASGALAILEAAGGRSNDFLADDGLMQGNRLIDRLARTLPGAGRVVRGAAGALVLRDGGGGLS